MTPPTLPLLHQDGPLPPSSYTEPSKKIYDGTDLQFFLSSLAYRDITTFILQLNRSIVPRKRSADGTIREFTIDSIKESDVSPQVLQIQQLVSKLDGLIERAPPETGPRRFGNVAFRTWYKLVEEQVDFQLQKALPEELHPAVIELKAYLLGSFGSAQRLDYGTGHELSFLAFVACLWKLKYFTTSTIPSSDSEQDLTSTLSRQIVLVLIQPYLVLIRKLIQTYNLEPAGSHGVWGLDDNSFLPYIFGSAQYSPAIPENPSPSTMLISTSTHPQPQSQPTPAPTTGSLPTAPPQSDVANPSLTARHAPTNLYFSAIHFIHTIKRGPFWEHSPLLYDISGIKDGWGKMNKGLIKMYDAEVLGKFPVVQHFVFGRILRWEKDPDAKVVGGSTHQASQPLRDPGGASAAVSGTNSGGVRTAPPWAAAGRSTGPPAPPTGFVNGVTQAPWARGGGAAGAAGTAGARSAVSPAGRGRMPPPLMSLQASSQSRREGVGVNPSRMPDASPVSAATRGAVALVEKTAETIAEQKEGGEET